MTTHRSLQTKAKLPDNYTSFNSQLREKFTKEAPEVEPRDLPDENKKAKQDGSNATVQMVKSNPLVVDEGARS